MSDDRLYDIDTLLDEVVTLPSMPDSLARITQLINDPNAALSDVGKAISADPSIALKTLRLVNSVYYGLDQKVSTVEHAVVLLGAKVVKNMVVSATVFDSIKGEEASFMRHSAACGIAMRVLAANGHLDAYFDDPEEAFVYGLLHDIGRVIMRQYLPSECDEIEEHVKESNIPWFQAERQVIGVDHAAIGARLAAKWKLSPQVVGAIEAHHDTSKCPADLRKLAANLTIADYVCTASGFPSHEDSVVSPTDEVWSAAGVDGKALMQVLDHFFNAVPDIDELVSANE